MNIYEQRLRAVLDVVQRYLPPDSPITEHAALSAIIGLVDPWPGQPALAGTPKTLPGVDPVRAALEELVACNRRSLANDTEAGHEGALERHRIRNRLNLAWAAARASLASPVLPWPQSNPWALAVDEAMVAAMLDCTVPESDPAACLRQLIAWHVAVATDPAVIVPMRDEPARAVEVQLLTDADIDAIAVKQDTDAGEMWFTTQLTHAEWRGFAEDIERESIRKNAAAFEAAWVTVTVKE